MFVTCLVDQMQPQIGVAMFKLLSRLGVEVSFNPEQTCCGQPAFNMGYWEEARAVAAKMLQTFERELEWADYIVAPSGSCTAMVKKFYVELFEDDEGERSRAERVGARVLELSQFLSDVHGSDDIGASLRGRVTYHDSCHLLRELGVAREPRNLIKSVRGVEFIELEGADVCCGFGGAFSVKYPEISTAIAEEKVAGIERSGADTVVACDAGCLMQISGLLSRRGSGVRCIHLAELLAGE